MKLDLSKLATATGGTLVVAAGKKDAKPNLQHHKTFGVKKPKSTTIPRRKTPSGNVEAPFRNKRYEFDPVDRDKLKRGKQELKDAALFEKIRGWLKSAGFTQSKISPSSFDLHFGKKSGYIDVEIGGSLVTILAVVSFTHTYDNQFTLEVEAGKLKESHIKDTVTWVRGVTRAMTGIPALPKFFTK